MVIQPAGLCVRRAYIARVRDRDDRKCANEACPHAYLGILRRVQPRSPVQVHGLQSTPALQLEETKNTHMASLGNDVHCMSCTIG